MDNKKLIEEMMKELNGFLLYAYKKSGIRGNESFLENCVVLKHGEHRIRSSFLGEYVEPTEEYPEGRIILYMDALSHYSKYIGRNIYDVAAKIFFAQVHNYISYKNKGKTNFKRAERFATRACRKLLKQKMLTGEPPIFYIEHDDEGMYYQRGLRQIWVQEWTGMTLQQIADTLRDDYNIEVDMPEEVESE